MIELTIRRARNAAGILKPVTAMTLQHTYAVHCLENGESIRELQHALGHQHIKDGRKIFRPFNTRCILPANLESPLDPIKRNQRNDRLQTEQDRPQNSPDKKSAVCSLQSVVSPAVLDLPFTEPSADLASRFYRMLKTLISGRFLGSRRSGNRSG